MVAADELPEVSHGLIPAAIVPFELPTLTPIQRSKPFLPTAIREVKAAHVRLAARPSVRRPDHITQGR